MLCPSAREAPPDRVTKPVTPKVVEKFPEVPVSPPPLSVIPSAERVLEKTAVAPETSPVTARDAPVIAPPIAAARADKSPEKAPVPPAVRLLVMEADPHAITPGVAMELAVVAPREVLPEVRVSVVRGILRG